MSEHHFIAVTKVISGGQTGADQGGLLAGEALGLATGGWAPLGWRTDEGPRPDLGTRFGLREHPSHYYTDRTRRNVRDASGTLVVGDPTSPGSKLTLRYCREQEKPVCVVSWSTGAPFGLYEVDELRAWLTQAGVVVLNVAGNRERVNPGITAATTELLLRSLRE